MSWICGTVKYEKGWRIRYNSGIYDLYKICNSHSIVKFRREQWTGRDQKRAYHITKKTQQQTIHSRRRVGKPRKRWEEGVREDAIALLGLWALKTKGKDTESENLRGNE